MRRAALAVGALLVLAALAAVLVAPRFIDTPAVRAEIQRLLSEALHGQVEWRSLEVALLPAPHGELSGLRVDIPGKLTLSAQEVRVYLRLWPLLRGSPEVSSVTVRNPVIRLARAESGGDAGFDAVSAYRKVMQPAVQALREFAPQTTLRIEGAALDALHDVNVEARTGEDGVDIELAAASPYWKRLSVSGRVEYAELAARAQVELDALLIDKDVPPVRLRAQLRADARSAIECDFEAAAGSLAAAKGKLLLPAGKPVQLAAHLSELDLPQALALARRKLPGLDAIESADGRLSADASASLEPSWQVQLRIVKSNAAIKLVQLPWKVSAHAAQVTITEKEIRVAGAKGAVGDSPFGDVAAHIELGKAARLAAASGQATIRLEQWFPWLQTKVALDPVDSLSGDADVTLKRLALRFDRPAEVDFDALLAPRKVSARLKALPAPVGVAGGTVRADSASVRLDRLAVEMLDLRAQVSGRFSLHKQSLELALDEGVAGEKIVRWAIGQGGVPARFEPRTPLRFSAQRIAWAPKGALEADAHVEPDGGPALGIALAWRPERLELRRVTIKDARSDAVLGASIAADLIQASFSGTLQGRSLAAVLRNPHEGSGSARGELRVAIDRKQAERTYAEGRLRIEGLDLSWLAGKKVLIERADITSERSGLRVFDSRFGWEDQFFDVRGEVRRTGQGPVIDARIESAGVMLERLLPPPDPGAPRKKSSALWPLPVSGRVEVRTAFAQYKDYRIEPFDGIVTLEPRRARLEVKEARMCGVSFPMEIDAEPEHAAAAAHIRIEKQPLERTVRCLTGGNVELTGTADLKAELRTKGRRPHLVRGLTGTLETEVREGRVRKFALLGNILSFRGLSSFGEKGDGFAYRSMTAKGRFEDGHFLVDESFFDSDALRLAAHGRVDMLGPGSELTVLVGLLTNVDRLAGAIPILGDIFGGSMTALPIAVHGDIRDPLIVPLGPRAVSDRLLGIFERTLKLPGKLVPAPP